MITLAAERFGWNRRPTPPAGSGYGFAFARYTNLEAYCAIALELAVDKDAGRTVVQRAAAAIALLKPEDGEGCGTGRADSSRPGEPNSQDRRPPYLSSFHR